MLVPATPPPITTARNSSTSGPRHLDRGLGSAQPVLEPVVARGRETPGEVTPSVVHVVEVQRRQRLLEHAPHRLAEVRHDPHQRQPRSMYVVDLPEILP